MTIEIKYEYTQELQDAIFVETAERRRDQIEKFTDAELTPAARAASLTALADAKNHPSYYGGYQPLATIDSDTTESIAKGGQWNHTTRIASISVSAVPTRSEALAEVERQIIAAAKLAPSILAAQQQRAAEAEEKRAAELAAAIEAYLALPLNVWLEGTAPNRELDKYHNNRGVLPRATSDLRKLDPRLDVRCSEAEQEAKRQNAAYLAKLAESAAALTRLITQHGTPDQIERHAAGVLPEQELAYLVRDTLFSALNKIPTYTAIRESDVAAECGCDTDEVRFLSETIESPELDADEFATLKAVRAAAPTGSEIEIRTHVGYEQGHDNASDPEIRRNGIRVTVEFAGRNWSREYAM